jgi:hypothetical protein
VYDGVEKEKILKYKLEKERVGSDIERERIPDLSC